MVIAVWRRQPREMLSRLRSTVQEAVSLNSMIFALLIGGGIFSFYTVGAGIPSQFTRWVLGFDLPPLVIVIVLLLALVPLGMFLDPLSIMLIGVPIAFPLVMELGLDGVWFGILFVKFIEVGLITPPLGLNAFVVAGTTKDLTPEIAFKGILAYLPLDLLTIALIFIFPIIVTIVPTLVGG
jgi:TRAP-type C4-dicarboxylate transport system permease large subunit